MRAVSYSRYGGPEVLEIVELEDPPVPEGSVRVAVRAAGLNPFDYKVRRGGYLPNHTLPALQGAEFAGVVESVGVGVTRWRVGDEVLGWVGRGAQAELVVVKEHQLAPKPAALSWEAAGAVGLVGNTAVRALAALELTSDDTLLVSGATGGVGLTACQLAVRAGARVVGLASERNHELLRSLGVEPVTYGDGQVERLRALGLEFTAMLDTVGGAAIEAGLALGVAPTRINTIADYAAAEEHGLLAVGGGGKTSEELSNLARQVADSELVLPVRATFALDDVRAAYRELEDGRGPGKVVLLVGQ